MLFNSISYAIFLPIVFCIYWFIARGAFKIQNIILLIASYVFYGWWDWRFLILLFFLSVSNYLIGIRLECIESDKKRKLWLLVSLIINLGTLGFFKYFNFFIDSFIDFVSVFGYELPRSTTKIILPIGISFYVFLALSYTIDIYRRNLRATNNIFEVLLTLSFFPIILAGPIQRPALLLPQIEKQRKFYYRDGIDGLKQILWGLFAKIVIADNLATYVDEYFQNYSNYSGSTLVIGAVFYSIQIYADFSGYSDIAIGTAKLFGFNLMRNFNFPYFSRDIAEFWKRWHISLTQWFRDYVFMPLSFSISWKISNYKVLFIKKELIVFILASLITWMLTGLWHGAQYKYIFWGLIHGSLLVFYYLQRNLRKNLLIKLGISNINIILVIFERMMTLSIVTIAWIFFKADDIKYAFDYLFSIFSESLFSIPIFPGGQKIYSIILLTIIFFIIEWNGRCQSYGLSNLGTNYKRPFRYIIYYALIISILWYGAKEHQFIYFKF